jgi:hypothetical protein
MRPGQVAWYVLRRGLGVGRGAIRRGPVGVRGVASHTSFIQPETEQDLVEGVAFLNRFRGFGSGPMDWRAAEMPKLWRYNLHYFDYLHWPRVSDRRKAELIASWIGANPPGTPDGWEPYTVSLRIVNWVKLFIGPEWRERVAQVWLDSLADQAAWLARNLEYHILANHYLKNGKALLVESRLHFHPDLSVSSDAGVVTVAETSGRVLLTVTPGEGRAPVLERGWYCPVFGVERENAVMVLRREADLPVRLGYVLRRPEP